MQEVAVSLEPAQSGGEVKLNLEALNQEEDEPRRSLPIVRTSVLAVSPGQAPAPAPADTSEIQPALSPEHQASVQRTQNYKDRASALQQSNLMGNIRCKCPSRHTSYANLWAYTC